MHQAEDGHGELPTGIRDRGCILPSDMPVRSRAYDLHEFSVEDEAGR
jgi:hypothetical protein